MHREKEEEGLDSSNALVFVFMFFFMSARVWLVNKFPYSGDSSSDFLLWTTVSLLPTAEYTEETKLKTDCKIETYQANQADIQNPMAAAPLDIIALFGEMIIMIIVPWTVAVWGCNSRSSHNRNYWDLFTDMPKPQSLHSPEDDKTGRMEGRGKRNKE